MQRNQVPSLSCHKASGLGVARIGGRDVYFGPHGTSEAQAPYDKAIAEWLASGRAQPPGCRPAPLTIGELILHFWPHVEQHYRDADGQPTREVDE
jgi:hypothetical protein